MADRTVPVSDPDTLPITGLTELLSHLEAINNDPDTPIQEKLFDHVELQLTDVNSPPLLPTFLPLLTKPLFTHPLSNPQPLLTILTKLLSPVAFQQILTFTDPAQLLFALRSPLPGANILALSILQKASASTEDIRTLVDLSSGELVGEVITLWVSTRDTGAAERAARVLTEWLEMDCEVVVPPLTPAAANGISHWTFSTTTRSRQQRLRLDTAGQGLLWNLIFKNPDNLTRILANCTLVLPPSISAHLPPDTHPRPRHAISTSQGRLLRLLPTLLSLNILPLLHDHSPLFHSFNCTSRNILSWAALEMIDQDDMLMRLTLIDFFEGLVSVARVATHQPDVKDNFVKGLVRIAMGKDERGEVRRAMVTLPDRTVEEEAEQLRAYLRDVIG